MGMNAFGDYLKIANCRIDDFNKLLVINTEVCAFINGPQIGINQAVIDKYTKYKENIDRDNLIKESYKILKLCGYNFPDILEGEDE